MIKIEELTDGIMGVKFVDKCDPSICELYLKITNKYGNQFAETKEEQKELVDAIINIATNSNSEFDYKIELLSSMLIKLRSHKDKIFPNRFGH